MNSWLESDADLPIKRRRTAQRLYECLQIEGYKGSYSAVQRHVKDWKRLRPGSPAIKQVFIPLAFPPGESCQFDGSHETVVMGGIEQVVKVAHFRLTYSRQMFVIACPRETQEMVMDAHNQAFSYLGGVPKRMVYDHLKTVVDAIFVGKERRFNRRFLTLANHYLFEPVAIRLVRDRILKQDKGDRAFVDLLLMARELGDGGLDALEMACDLTWQTGVISASIVQNEMRRLTEAAQPKALVDTPASTPVLTLEPVADCSRYDSLRSAKHVH